MALLDVRNSNGYTSCSMFIKLCASHFCFILVLWVNLPWRIHAWIDYEEVELYDLVEAVNVNFYELLEVNQTATTAEIKRSFRVLSLKYHPDKNKEADAEVKFRNLVAVADVLKNETKRKKYDQILVNGLPDWRSGVYYYRRVRKLGLLEMSVIVSIILTFGHYLCILAAFWEKNYEVSEQLRRRSRRQRTLSNQQIEEIKSEMLQSLGVTYPRILYDNLIFLSRCYEKLKEYSRQSNEEESVQEEIVRPKRTKPKPVEPPNFEDLYARIENRVLNNEVNEINNTEAESRNERSLKSEWSETDIHQLIKLTKKFPGGIPERWERIACVMARNPDDVAKKAREVKSGSIKCSTGNNDFVPLNNDCENDISENRAESRNDNIWSQEQQK
ncbi:dnaJ subfamily C member 1-like protein, partial [Leptotrombidium deliense]